MVYATAKQAASTNIMYAYDLLQAQLTAHPAWQMVEVNNTGGAGVTATVWRNLGTANGVGDWYLHVGRSTAAAPVQLWLTVSEGYNQTTKRLIRAVPSDALVGTTVPAATDFSWTDEPLLWSGSSATAFNPNLFYRQLAGTTTDAYVVVTRTGVFIWMTGATAAVGATAQLFESFLGASEPFPLVLANINKGTAVNDAGVTRMPTVVTTGAANWRVQAPLWETTPWTKTVGIVGSSGDRFFNNRPIGGRRLVQTNGDPTTYGGLRGLYRDILGFTSATVILPGDTLTIGTDVYAQADRAATGTPLAWVNTSAA